MYDPDKVIFISFSLHMTQRVAEEAPDFTNQYLEHDKTPQMLAAMNINGMDYNYKVYQNFQRLREQYGRAHCQGNNMPDKQ